MKVRKLENKDAVTMLEWMHEEDIIKPRLFMEIS